MNVHGDANSHIDALCHVIYDDKLYNNVSVDTLTPTGASMLSIDMAHDGIVGRGVLLDIPRARHVVAGARRSRDRRRRRGRRDGQGLRVNPATSCSCGSDTVGDETNSGHGMRQTPAPAFTPPRWNSSLSGG